VCFENTESRTGGHFYFTQPEDFSISLRQSATVRREDLISPVGRRRASDLSHRVRLGYRILHQEEARLPTALPTAASPSLTTLDQVAP